MDRNDNKFKQVKSKDKEQQNKKKKYDQECESMDLKINRRADHTDPQDDECRDSDQEYEIRFGNE